MSKVNLESGFLLMYDWWDAFECLSDREFRELLTALVERQRDGAPIPSFESPNCRFAAKVIEPFIKKRLAGVLSAKKDASPVTEEIPAEVPSTVPSTQPSTVPAPQRREEKRGEEKENRRSREEEGREEETPAPASMLRTDAPREREDAFCEEERETLIQKTVQAGVPRQYAEERMERAELFARRQGTSPDALLADWWRQDRPRAPQSPAKSAIALGNSFDADDFLAAAIRHSTENAARIAAESSE